MTCHRFFNAVADRTIGTVLGMVICGAAETTGSFDQAIRSISTMKTPDNICLLLCTPPGVLGRLLWGVGRGAYAGLTNGINGSFEEYAGINVEYHHIDAPDYKPLSHNRR